MLRKLSLFLISSSEEDDGPSCLLVLAPLSSTALASGLAPSSACIRERQALEFEQHEAASTCRHADSEQQTLRSDLAALERSEDDLAPALAGGSRGLVATSIPPGRAVPAPGRVFPGNGG